MIARHNKPSVRQAAAMMPPGPDRDALFERADQIYAAGPGPFLEKRIAAVQRALEMIWATQEAQFKTNPAQPPAMAREHLRYENQLDRMTRAHAALWEDALHTAREAIFRETGKRLAVQVYEMDENWHDLKKRLYHDSYYAKHRPELETSHRVEPRAALKTAPRAETTPKPAPVTEPATETAPAASTAPATESTTAPKAETARPTQPPQRPETPRQTQPLPGLAIPRGDFSALFEAVRQKLARPTPIQPPLQQPPGDPHVA
ncbi:MAG: hypothetical protein HS108_06930 [Planctomycetes bacterium]|nr:hypothetical protein [Planctomycetota bacterium]